MVRSGCTRNLVHCLLCVFNYLSTLTNASGSVGCDLSPKVCATAILVRGHPITTWTRWGRGGGQKNSVFVHAKGIKTVHAGQGEWQNSGVRDRLFSLHNVVLKVFLFFSLSFPKNNAVSIVGFCWKLHNLPTLINNNWACSLIYFWKKFHPAHFFMI